MTIAPVEDLAAADDLDRDRIMDYFREELRRIVSTHTVMFDKLLFQDDNLPLELAELFEDIANTYLDISERISSRYQVRISKVK